ncbi:MULTISPECIES: peptidase C39 family protein [unclassified Streptomyces]|uniref:peptidase C39 family protein n=1 Tax=unclassified Streptomyces TaxID=2593676 RepID=UPI001BE6AC16|nr:MULTISPECIES: peptidase C39 family protein [unclassified Streptomyces]MBT2407284.1 peptidase C39 family protein [Streptomyces sp. ISL-21]MBT2459413.1 peptidase C39 family protein [Streptomyces sp. ISL-86]MBT2613419.1 peptidase C39 family protein [Streptomyces sp. ISL-87]
MTAPTPRRAVLVAALAVAAATVSGGSASASAPKGDGALPPGKGAGRTVDNRFWYAYRHWLAGTHNGTAATRGAHGGRAGLEIGTPAGRTEYQDPHTGKKSTWEYAAWTSPMHRSTVPATEAIASWNAHTPAGTWIQTELRGTYTDATTTPWYVMGRWASGDGDIRRTSVDGQTDGKTTVWTDTLAVDHHESGLRITDWQLRLTLHRRPGSAGGPVVWLAGAMVSDIPDRFTVPASVPTAGGGRELKVPRYSQETHAGQYPEYDNGGEAWCSPTSSQMIIEYWGGKPDGKALAWVNPKYKDPQVCHAARSTYDAAYKGCGNWPFNAAYAATYRGLAGVVTRLSSLADLETLVRAGIPAITSQSFRPEELTGAGYGTAGHLMTVIGFTEGGDVIANDPNSADNPAVRRVYKRREFENIWLRTKRHNAAGKVVSGSGGICYLYAPARPAPDGIRALRAVGVI